MLEIIHTYLPVTAGRKEPVSSGISVADYITSGGYDRSCPVVCSYNGRPALRAEWKNLIILDHDMVIIIHLPQGGGGGSDPLRIAATIGLMALALSAPGFGIFVGTMFSGGFGGALLSAGIMMGGSYLLNAVMPVKSASASMDTSATSTSPTYSLSSPTNTSRLDQAIPVQYGRVKTTPALISKSWFEFTGDNQYVYILLGLGMGHYEIESLKFDTIDFKDCKYATYQIVEPGGTVPYSDNVFTSSHVSGQEIYREDAKETLDILLDHIATPTAWVLIWTMDSSSIGQKMKWKKGDVVYFENATVNTGHYTLSQDPSWGEDIYPNMAVMFFEELIYQEHTPHVNIKYVDSSNLYTDFYPAYPNDPIPSANRSVCCDIVFPQGLFRVQNDGSVTSASVTFQIMVKNVSLGTGSVGAPYSIGSPVTVTRNQRTPVRISISAQFGSETDVAHLVGIKRTDSVISAQKVDTCNWVGLRVIYPDIGSYQGVTVIAVKAIASSGLNNDALSKINVVSTRKLSDLVGIQGSDLVPTRSIASAVLDACKNSDYSIGLTDADLDLDALTALDELWRSRGDYCDGVFDTKATFWDSLSAILKTGRAHPHCIGGKITFTRDQAQAVIKGVFGVRNIVRGSFSIDYLMYDPDTPDDVEVEFMDAETWAWKTVTCSLPGSSSEAPASLKKWGITDQAQAEREGKYEAACNMYRRTFVTFQTELDARIIKRGDLISVSHPLPSWGVSGEIIGVSDQTLTLSEPVTMTSENFISFRRPNGTQDGPYPCLVGVDAKHVVMVNPIPSHVYTGYDRARTIFQFGSGESGVYERQCLVISARPRSGNTVELLCVVENSAVHSADGTGS